MNTTVDMIKDYVLKEYGLNFKIEVYGTHRNLIYKKAKKEYEFYCNYAYHPEIENGVHFWSIYYDFMDYNKWYGYGGTYIDEGIETIDKIMEMYGLKKQQEQLTLF